MIPKASYFFCGVGGSGMTPLALIVQARGAQVAGSDRALDQGRNPERFAFLQRRGVTLAPQDGSGLTRREQTLVVSAAVEETIPDVQAARRLGAPIVTRAQLLAELFNAAPVSVGVAGTSGKSTTTAMIGWIAARAGLDPTIVNGAEMKNFAAAGSPFASAVVGGGEAFIAEVDESDGSIALYAPKVAVVNNISLDHKTMDELRALFAGFVGRAEHAVLNLDNEETAALARAAGPSKLATFSLADPAADFLAGPRTPLPGGVAFEVSARRSGRTARVTLKTPGDHNAANALAAIAATDALGVDLETAAAALSAFAGVKRRLDVIGEAGGVTVIDDFAHNPDKIAATLATLHAYPGRLLVMFQPHGYGPLKLMRAAFAETFVRGLAADDVLVLTPPVYFGGTVDRSVGSAEVAADIAARGHAAEALGSRAACGERLLALARPGDRIVVMGARDDSLSTFAGELLARLANLDVVAARGSADSGVRQSDQSSRDDIPASDRCVQLDHNSSDYHELVASLDELAELVRGNNALFGPIEKDRIAAELAASKRLLTAGEVRVSAASSVIGGVLQSLARRFPDFVIGILASATCALLMKVLGL